MQPIVKTYDQLTTRELYEILKSRFWVFVMEQQCFYLDMDNVDYRAKHVFLWDTDNVEQTEQGPNPMPITAYARLFKDTERDIWHIGRMLTLHRKQHLGTQIMQQCIEAARQHGATLVDIDAQCHAIDFYRHFGFIVTSEPFDEAGIKHVKMKLRL